MKLLPKQSIMLSLFVLLFMLISVLAVVIPHAFGFTMAIVNSDAMEPTYSENLSGTLSQVLAIRNAGLILFCVGKGILFIYIFSCLYFFLTLFVLSPCIIMPSRQLLRQQLHLLGKRRILLHTDMPHILQQS